MTDPLFQKVCWRTDSILREVRGLEAYMRSLPQLRSFETIPAANLKEIAQRFEDTAKFVRECADKAPKPIKENA
jgi:hypothetical protein